MKVDSGKATNETKASLKVAEAKLGGNRSKGKSARWRLAELKCDESALDEG